MQKPTKAAVNSPEAIKPVGTKLKFENSGNLRGFVQAA